MIVKTTKLAVTQGLDGFQKIKFEIAIENIDRELKKQLPFKKEYEVAIRDHLGMPENICFWMKDTSLVAAILSYYIQMGWSEAEYYPEHNAFLFKK